MQGVQAMGRPDGGVCIGFWTKEIGAIAFQVNQQAIDALRRELAVAEQRLHEPTEQKKRIPDRAD
jgi:hypothetical protein